MVIWWYGDMVIWWYGDMVIWWYGDMVIWWYGDMVIWWYGDMVMMMMMMMMMMAFILLHPANHSKLHIVSIWPIGNWGSSSQIGMDDLDLGWWMMIWVFLEKNGIILIPNKNSKNKPLLENDLISRKMRIVGCWDPRDSFAFIKCLPLLRVKKDMVSIRDPLKGHSRTCVAVPGVSPGIEESHAPKNPHYMVPQIVLISSPIEP